MPSSLILAPLGVLHAVALLLCGAEPVAILLAVELALACGCLLAARDREPATVAVPRRLLTEGAAS